MIVDRHVVGPAQPLVTGAAAGEEDQEDADPLRLRLIKIGGKVRERTRWVCVRLASRHPREALWRALAARPSRS